MYQKIFLVVFAVSALLTQGIATAQTNDEVAELRALVKELRQDYEARISELEARLDRAEAVATSARRDASEAYDVAQQAAVTQPAAASAANTFNPSVGAVLQGSYARVRNGWDALPGFQPAGEIGTGESGYALGEAEVNFKANVDDRFFGNLTFGIASEDGEVELELEEAWVQTTGLPGGASVRGGRFFSSAGYLNGFHFHADDFVDRPLPYQAFVGGRYGVDGIHASWLAPTPMLLELGAELNWGASFPATATASTSPDAWTLYAKTGGDVGTDNSWKLGISHIAADAVEREGGDGLFTGDSDLTIVDFIWKWAPEGNPAVTNWKVQAEYFQRDESGFYDAIPYAGDQQGWYLQGVWQFRPLWRVGLRYDMVDADNGAALAGTDLEDPARQSRRTALMLDWSPSEFSRLRLQYNDDRVLAESDRQWFLQYIMSIGAHGAHQF